jgi:hypothetical protein
VSAPQVTWFASGQRAVVDDGAGTKWWVAPDGRGNYSVVRDDQEEVRMVGSMDEGLTSVLGDAAGPWLGRGR